MFFKNAKKIEEAVLENQNEIKEIKEILCGDYESKVKKLEEIETYLSNIHLKVKSISKTADNYGNLALKIIYELPQVILTFDENGNPQVNELFRSINALDLISQEEQMNLVSEIEKIKVN